MARGKKKTVIDTAHPHTIKKFELIEEYIKSWSQKLMLYENCNTLVFIDCMCNSGVYFDDDGNLVDGTSVLVANASPEHIKEYLISRLKTIFPCVSNNPRIFKNSKNSPMFSFCFAISNESVAAQRLALRIADHILKNK